MHRMDRPHSQSAPGRGRWPLGLLALTAATGGGALLALAWHYANVLKDGALDARHQPDRFDLEVVALEEGRITLRADGGVSSEGDWTREGTYGLEWEGGYGRLGAIRASAGREVVRDFIPFGGTPRVGVRARVDGFAFPGSPRHGHAIDFEEVSIPGELGALPAWLVPGASDTWAVFVHGKGSNRREVLRILPALQQMRLPVLAFGYRNHEGAPSSSDGFYRYGQTEWRDLDAAARYALEHGARDIVLVGYSMGGAIAVNCLFESEWATRVRGLILDSPMLDLSAAIDLGARRKGAPELLTGLVRWTAGWRFGVDWERLNYLRQAGRLAAPILLFHGDNDPTVPVAVSDALAAARPDLVTYHRVQGAAHVRSWNVDPAAYEAAVTEFLGRVAMPLPG